MVLSVKRKTKALSGYRTADLRLCFRICRKQVFQLDVKEVKVIEDHPQWDISNNEEEKEYNDNISEDSDYSMDEYDTE